MTHAIEAGRNRGLSIATPSALLVGVTVSWIAAIPIFPNGDRLVEALPIFSVERIGFAVVTALLLVHLLLDPSGRAPLSRVETAMAVFLAIVTLSWMSTIPRKDAVTIKQDADFLLTSFAMPLTAYWVGRTVRWTPARVFGCLAGLTAIAGVYLIIVGLIQGIYDWGFLVDEAFRKVHGDRAKGPFQNAVWFGLVLAMLLPAALYLYLEVRGRLARIAALLLVGGLVEGIILSKVRAIWIAVIVAMAFAASRCANLRRPAVAIVLLIVAQIGLALVDPVTLESILPFRLQASPHDMSERVGEVDSVMDRVATYATVVKMIAQRPLLGFGVGLSTYRHNRADYYSTCCGIPLRYAFIAGVPHNELLNIMILAGAVGLIAYLNVLWRMWRLLAKTAAATGSPHARLALCVQMMFVMLAIVGLSHDLLYVGYVTILLFFVFGIVAGQWASPPGRGAAR